MDAHASLSSFLLSRGHEEDLNVPGRPVTAAHRIGVYRNCTYRVNRKEGGHAEPGTIHGQGRFLVEGFDAPLRRTYNITIIAGEGLR
jgi:hypothetical protein